jgi:hypothetical protein
VAKPTKRKDLAKRFFAMAAQLLQRRWEIYPKLLLKIRTKVTLNSAKLNAM